MVVTYHQGLSIWLGCHWPFKLLDIQSSLNSAIFRLHVSQGEGEQVAICNLRPKARWQVSPSVLHGSPPPLPPPGHVRLPTRLGWSNFLFSAFMVRLGCQFIPNPVQSTRLVMGLGYLLWTLCKRSCNVSSKSSALQWNCDVLYSFSSCFGS